MMRKRRARGIGSGARVALVLAAGALASCRSAGVSDALGACDYAEACGKAVAQVRATPPGSRPVTTARLVALHTEVNAVARFPSPADAFLAQAGLKGPGWVDAVTADAEALRSATPDPAPDVVDALDVLAYLREPTCKRLTRVEEISSGSGRFSDSARMARTAVLAQFLSAVDADRVHLFADGGRSLVGCSMSEQASSSAVLVEARNRLYDLVDTCPADGSGDAAFRASCAEVRKLTSTRELPLPLGEASSGEVSGAWVPVATRGVGMTFTPPWMLVLSSGRLVLVDQVSLKPGERQVRDPQPLEIIDLRTRHRPDHVASGLNQAFKTRKPYGRTAEPVVALAVDASSSTADLLEVLEGILSETDAVPVFALLPASSRTPVWFPLNYRIPTRILLDPTGARRAFSGPTTAVGLELTPFSATFKTASSERTAEIRRADDPATKGPDLREVYRAALEFAGSDGGKPPTLLVRAEPTVPAGVLLSLLETLSVRVPSATLATVSQFVQAPALRVKGGLPDGLFPVSVLLRNEADEEP